MKNLLKIKTNAGALQYTIFISVVIALVIFAFISLTYVNQKLRLKNHVFKEVSFQNELAFHQIENRYNYGIEEFSDKNEISRAVHKKQWGVFDVISISTKKGKEEITKTAFFGSNEKERPALYLQDDNQPLVLVGSTKIEGRALLPQQGVKRGSIAGHSYNGSQLVYGNKRTSEQQLPTSNTLKKLLAFKDSMNTHIDLAELTPEEGGEINNAFSNETYFVVADNSIELRDTKLIGNIVIMSNSKVTVHQSAKLNDVIIVAPHIEVKDNVIGNFQAIADKKLMIGKNVTLSYPTTLLLSEKLLAANQNQQPGNVNQIRIDKNSTVRGIVAFLTENKDVNYSTQVIIEENTIITGEVYCEQNVELKGIVNGSVYTKGFIANQFGSIYKNHIYNGHISSRHLPKQYVGLSFQNSKQKVAKWLYY